MADNLNSDALKLAMFRKTKGITQGAIAEILWPNDQEDTKRRASSIRKISYIEGGGRKLREEEIERLTKKWAEFRNFAPLDSFLSIPSKDLMRCLESEEFLIRQQRYLEDKSHCGNYDLWIFNGQIQPIQTSGNYRHSWTNNLSNGSSYWVLWDLGEFQGTDLQEFILFFQTIVGILNMVEGPRPSDNASGGAKSIGGITIFPFIKDAALWTDNGRSSECNIRFKALCMGIEREVKRLVDSSAELAVAKPFACWCGDEPPSILAKPSREAVRLLIDCYHSAASTVVYLPNLPLGLLTLAAIEPPEVPHDFDDLDDKQTRHMLLEPDLAFRMGRAILDFQAWAANPTNLPRIFPNKLVFDKREERANATIC